MRPLRGCDGRVDLLKQLLHLMLMKNFQENLFLNMKNMLKHILEQKDLPI